MDAATPKPLGEQGLRFHKMANRIATTILLVVSLLLNWFVIDLNKKLTALTEQLEQRADDLKTAIKEQNPYENEEEINP